MITWPKNRDEFEHLVATIGTAMVSLLPCTFILDNGVTNTFILLISIVWLYLTIATKAYFNFNFGNITVILFAVSFLLQVISLSYTENLDMGFANFETKLSFLFFPIVFFSGYNILENIRLKETLFVFVQCVSIVCIYILIRIVISSDDLRSAWNEYTFENLSGVMSLHPGYFSFVVCFSVLVLILQFRLHSKNIKALMVCEIILLVVFSFRLASRMPLVGLGVCLLVYALYERKFKLIIIGLLTVGILSFLVTENSPDMKERYQRPITLLLTGDIDSLKTYVFNRIDIYSCAVELLSGPEILTGVGTGDVNGSLIQCYDKHDYWWVSRQKYNAHNEYFQTTLEVGILGGLIFVFLLIYPVQFWSSLKEFPLFALLFGIFSLTESTLQVQKGVYFFCFFYMLFVAFTRKRTNPRLLHSR